VEQGLRVILEGETRLIIPNSEATLKGVKDDAVIEVFGPEIYGLSLEAPSEGRNYSMCEHVHLS
jgi:hypothetical protein